MKTTIAIIGYGMVGKTVHQGFTDVDVVIVDPAYNTNTVADACQPHVEAIFVCVPTPADEPTFDTLTTTLDQIEATGYKGLVVVKSTVLPQYIQSRDIIFNPEFLSRATALDDLINPPYVIVAGNRSEQLIDLFRRHTPMDLTNVYYVDIPTAAFIKYTANTFYALKVTFMNEMHKVAGDMGANYNQAASILTTNPAFGNNHASVPGPDGEFGFGGPCLPKDTAALVRHFSSDLLSKALELNSKFRV